MRWIAAFIVARLQVLAVAARPVRVTGEPVPARRFPAATSRFPGPQHGSCTRSLGAGSTIRTIRRASSAGTRYSSGLLCRNLANRSSRYANT